MNKTQFEKDLILSFENNENKVIADIDDVSLSDRKYSFIVEYKPAEKNILLKKLEQLGCPIDVKLPFINAVVITVSMKQLAILKTCTCVESIERNYEYAVLKENKNDTHIKLLAGKPSTKQTNIKIHEENQKSLLDIHNKNIRGQKTTIAILDTGISLKRENSIQKNVTFVSESSSPSDSHGHGTQMAGILLGSVEHAIIGVAPDTTLYSVQVADERGLLRQLLLSRD